ncbi:MAG TPA: hypothetical protein VD735_01780 [Candidatus Saccharimonadales bacterium]|nr:hypothetical protein [Candidatus Saccharimonadales bacterium]
MDGIFNTGVSFWQFVGGVILLAISVIAVRITFNFDVNQYLVRKDKKLDRKIKNACTHLHMELVGKDDGMPLYSVQSLFESPPGTHKWQCQRCGLIKNHDNDSDKRAEYYAKNPDEYIKMNKKFQKLIRKGGAV